MVSGKHKTKRFRKVFVKTPGAKTVVHYRQRKPQAHKCAECGAILKGMPRLLPGKQKNTAKSKKTVERPYGGHLCTKCTRKHIKEYARGLEQ